MSGRLCACGKWKARTAALCVACQKAQFGWAYDPDKLHDCPWCATAWSTAGRLAEHVARWHPDPPEAA